MKLKIPIEPGLILALVSRGRMAGKRKAEEGKVRWRQAEAVKKQAEAEQQEARKVCRRQAEAAKRQTEACTLAVKRQKRQRYTTEVAKMQSRGRQKKAEAEWLARGRERQVFTSRCR